MLLDQERNANRELRRKPEAHRQGDGVDEVKAATGVKYERVEIQIIIVIVKVIVKVIVVVVPEDHRKPGFAENGPLSVKPEIPLHDHWQDELTVIVMTKFASTPVAVIITAKQHVEPEADADGVVDLGDEPLVHDHDGATKAWPKSGAAMAMAVPKDEMRFRLENVVGVCTGTLDNALSAGARRHQKEPASQ